MIPWSIGHIRDVMLAGKKLQSDVGQAFEVRMGSAVVPHEHNFSTMSSQGCVLLPYPFLQQNPCHPCILFRVVFDWQCIYVYISKTSWLSALAKHYKFQFITASHVGTAEDCDSIHRFLRATKLLKRVTQPAIRCRSVVHASLVSIVDIFWLVLAQKLR